MVEPLVDLVDEGGHLYLEIAVPGILESDIDLTIQGSRLILTADRPAIRGSYLRHEIERGVLVRVVDLPYAVALGHSTYEEGVLRLELLRTAES